MGFLQVQRDATTPAGTQLLSVRIIFTVIILYRLAGSQWLASPGVFSDELRKLRLAAALTQEQVAISAGVTREYVSMLESGKSSPTIDVFIRLCWAVKAPPSDVIQKLERSMPKGPR